MEKEKEKEKESVKGARTRVMLTSAADLKGLQRREEWAPKACWSSNSYITSINHSGPIPKVS
jgi:hypothetical protein